jgi:nucleotide-binding universal stress UspA family protein
MTYATLMVHTQIGQSNTSLLQIAGDLAQRLQANLVGIAVCQPMRILYNDGYVPSDVIEQDRKQIDDDMRAAESEFRLAFPKSDFRPIVTYKSLSDSIAREARCADLIISGVDRNVSMFDTSRHVDMGDLVMQAGRPCLIVPQETLEFGVKNVVVGWKESGESRRAIRDALPLLKLAAHVTVAEIAAAEDLPEVRARLDDVVAWLGRHTVKATPMATLATDDDAARLNMIAHDLGADLLVAGAYGHSRVREWILGGVTRNLLLRAERCALVSH